VYAFDAKLSDVALVSRARCVTWAKRRDVPPTLLLPTDEVIE